MPGLHPGRGLGCGRRGRGLSGTRAGEDQKGPHGAGGTPEQTLIQSAAGAPGSHCRG